jgi:methylated-DNA-[protein]-cysteine S-methyltransferase
MPRLALDSPIGTLTVTEKDGRIVALDWGGCEEGTPSPVLVAARQQLLDYFAGRRRDFDLKLAPSGSPIELRVWELMAAIPYGETRSYGALGHDLDLGPRAVGQACGRNKLPILIPCHRVIASDGSLGGYSGGGGAETKRRLLQLERALLL